MAYFSFILEKCRVIQWLRLLALGVFTMILTAGCSNSTTGYFGEETAPSETGGDDTSDTLSISVEAVTPTAKVEVIDNDVAVAGATGNESFNLNDTTGLATAAGGSLSVATSSLSPSPPSLSSINQATTLTDMLAELFDFVAGFDVTLKISGNFQVVNNGSCKFKAPFSGYLCRPGNVTIPPEDIQDGKIIAEAVAGSQSETSDEITGHRYVFTRLASTNANDSSPDGLVDLTIYNDRLYFWSANPSSSIKLFRYDIAQKTVNQMTHINTVAFGPLANRRESTQRTEFKVLGNQLLFPAKFNFPSNPEASKLYALDDTGVAPILERISNTTGTQTHAEAIRLYGVVNNELYFSGINSSYGRLFKYTPTPTPTVQLVNSEYRYTSHQGYFESELGLFLTGDNGTSAWLLHLTRDATPSLKEVLDDKFCSTHAGLSSTLAIDYNGKFFFIGRTGDTADECGDDYFVYRYDGTTVDVPFRTADGESNNPRFVGVHNGRLILMALNTLGVHKLYAYDDVSGAIEALPSINALATADTSTSYAGGFIAIGSDFYMPVSNGGAYYLYRYRHTTGLTYEATRVSDIVFSDAAGSSMILYAGKIFYRGEDSEGNAKIFAYDPSAHRSLKFANLIIGDEVFNPADAVIYNNRLYFAGGIGKLYSLYDSSLD